MHTKTIVPALPGYYVVGGIAPILDDERWIYWKTPIVAWRIEDGFANPITPAGGHGQPRKARQNRR